LLELISVIVHTGVTASTGHYVAFVKPDVRKLITEQQDALKRIPFCNDVECVTTSARQYEDYDVKLSGVILTNDALFLMLQMNYCQQPIAMDGYVWMMIGSACNASSTCWICYTHHKAEVQPIYCFIVNYHEARTASLAATATASAVIHGICDFIIHSRTDWQFMPHVLSTGVISA